MASFWNTVQMFFYNIFNRPKLVDYLDILIIAFLLYQLVKITRQTRAMQVFKGLAIVVVASYISDVVGFTVLSWVLRSVLNNGAVVLLLLFQPELRRALEQIGRGTRLERATQDSDEDNRIITQITQCLLRLSKRRVGALIVFEQRTGLKDIADTGTAIDAVISSQLIENIFEPNTPLHDGAVIIRGARVVAAACILTLSESSAISHDLGTRHRAALGTSEATDAIVLIVSEETGIISMARGGKLTRHLDAAALQKALAEMYNQPHSKVWKLLHRPAKAQKVGASNDES